MRAAKREKYGKKELEKLKMVLGLNTTDVEMKEEKLEDKLDDDVVIGEFWYPPYYYQYWYRFDW